VHGFRFAMHFGQLFTDLTKKSSIEQTGRSRKEIQTATALQLGSKPKELHPP